MDLTEPQAGSDLGAIVTRATEENDRSYLYGQKIFITNGGAEIHLVLARDHRVHRPRARAGGTPGRAPEQPRCPGPPSRLELATYWVNRKMLELELSARRVTECGVERIERFENIIELFD